MFSGYACAYDKDRSDKSEDVRLKCTINDSSDAMDLLPALD